MYIELHDGTINNLNGYEDYTFVTGLSYNTIKKIILLRLVYNGTLRLLAFKYRLWVINMAQF